MASADLLNTICDELDARLRELRPLLDEYESLLDAVAALELAGEEQGAANGGVPSQASAAAPSAKPARRRGRPPGKRSARRSASEPALKPKLVVDAGTGAGSSPRPAKRSTSRRRSTAAPKRAQRGAAAVAILAALEHGSHTVSELAVVTAMSGQIINSNLRRLQQAGTITRTRRAGDGKAAYALTATPA
jgi:MarR family